MSSYGETCSINRQKPKTKIKMKDVKKYKASHQKGQENQMQYVELRTIPCLWSVDKFFKPSPTSSSQERVTLTEHPASTRSENMNEDVQGNLSHGPPETEKPSKHDDDEELQSNQLQDVQDWLQEFRHGLVDESVPEHRDASSSSHELPLEPRAKVVSGKHSISTHFPKDPNEICLRIKITRAPCRRRLGRVVPRAENFGDLITADFPKRPRLCDICLKTKITRASCRKRTGTVVPRAEKVGDLITVDHKVLTEGCESRNNHRYFLVVQDLATQWIQSYPCKTKTSLETEKSLMKFLEPTRKPKVFYTSPHRKLLLHARFASLTEMGVCTKP